MKKQAAKIIKAQREKYGYSHDDIAAWIGKERSVYTRKENGKIPFSADEFLFVLEEFERRGPKSQHKALSIIVKNIKLLMKFIYIFFHYVLDTHIFLVYPKHKIKEKHARNTNQNLIT